MTEKISVREINGVVKKVTGLNPKVVGVNKDKTIYHCGILLDVQGQDEWVNVNTFDEEESKKKIENVEVDKAYKVTLETKNGYENVLAFTDLDAINVTTENVSREDSPKVAAVGGSTPSPTVQRLIVRQSCLSNALKYQELIKGPDTVIKLKNVRAVAKEFEEWVYRMKEEEEDEAVDI
ncbi:MAG: hypothetical protein CL811_06585 [Colwelliaceae bacterium]|jgi:hypothetical protein|nr:hypothetical protein [Colwelliaceae bacterium]|tara:strand:- start:4163 stop:4699 length:537 start_codon:yes stop_codon:yes gene_type:complete